MSGGLCNGHGSAARPIGSSMAWLATDSKPLPGSLDAVVHIMSRMDINGVKTHVEFVGYLFTNASVCGLTRDDLFNLE